MRGNGLARRQSTGTHRPGISYSRTESDQHGQSDSELNQGKRNSAQRQSEQRKSLYTEIGRMTSRSGCDCSALAIAMLEPRLDQFKTHFHRERLATHNQWAPPRGHANEAQGLTQPCEIYQSLQSSAHCIQRGCRVVQVLLCLEMIRARKLSTMPIDMAFGDAQPASESACRHSQRVASLQPQNGARTGSRSASDASP